MADTGVTIRCGDTSVRLCERRRHPHVIDTPADLPSEWFLIWDERAAIMEFDGGATRERAEHDALLDVIKQMRQAVRSQTGRCLETGFEDRTPPAASTENGAGADVLPVPDRNNSPLHNPSNSSTGYLTK